MVKLTSHKRKLKTVKLTSHNRFTTAVKRTIKVEQVARHTAQYHD